MKRLLIEPDGWPCTLSECPPGFFVFNERLGFKTEYGGEDEVFCDSGEYFWGGTTNKEERSNLIVQPCNYKWVDEE